MSEIVFSAKNFRTVLLLLVTLVVLAGWATTAHAQTSRDAQYGSPTASGEAAITASDPSATADPSAAEGSYGAGSASASSTSVTGVLPATGGPLVQLVALGAIALSSTGLLILRQNSRR